jgi:hypothetical protein
LDRIERKCRWASLGVEMAAAERDYASDVRSERDGQFEADVGVGDFFGFDDDRVVGSVRQHRHRRISLQQKDFSSIRGIPVWIGETECGLELETAEHFDPCRRKVCAARIRA